MEYINKIIQGNSLDVLRSMPDGVIDCCVTSPPYWGLRDYGHSDQLGLEPTPELYVQHITEIFNEIKRVLKPAGTLWLNLGDSYNGSGGAGGDYSKGGLKEGQPKYKGRNVKTYKPKDLIGIPWMVAFALRSTGWYLRSDIIWHKPNPMPESVTDRPTKSHEYIFLLSKSQKYYYDYEAILQPVADSTIGRGPVDFGGKKGREYKPVKGDPNYRNGSEQWGRTYDYSKGKKKSFKNLEYDGQQPNSFHLNGLNGNGDEFYPVRNKRSVWTVTTKPYKEAHFATYPQELIVDCIKAGCPEGGIVLDPFMGAGTTAVVARKLNRNYVGIELNPKYIEIANKRLEKELGLLI